MFWRAPKLNRLGVLGINRRNRDFVMRYNERKYYPFADDKLRTKSIAIAAGIAVPDLYGVIETQRDIRNLPQILDGRDGFVIKPACGSGGNGVLVLSRRGETFRRPDSRIMGYDEMGHHVSNILSGQYSLGGQPDRAMIEYRVRFDAVFEAVAYHGVPDLRIIVFKGYPVMAMVRLPTRASDGKANLHQGAIGVGIDIARGETLSGVAGTEIVNEHPDTLNPISGIKVPGWDAILELAAGTYELTKLGYMGVDIVLDRDRGPLILELNARPGLSIQIANRCGLHGRLLEIEALEKTERSPAERAAFARERFPAKVA
jgi:alpha-L-glutamate ligase-like protein